MKGEQHKVVVESLANSGDGVGRIQNKVVFIPFAAPGDELLVQITIDKKSFSKAKIIEILKPSDQRVEPPCPVFGRCGGCDWQHIDYPSQLYWKEENLRQTLAKIAKIQNLDLIKPIVPSTDQLGYRNRIQLQVDKKGFHYFSKGSHHPVHINECLLAGKEINSLLREKPPLSAGKVEIAKTANGPQFFKVGKNSETELGFRQVNDTQNQFLVEQCLRVIDEKNISRFYDLYCGQGNWAISINKKRPQIEGVGIDINPINIEKAKAFETSTLKFLEGSVEKLFPLQSQTADLVILDPPRAGCDSSVFESLKQKRPTFLIYISCHPATLARDIYTLSQSGWRPTEIVPVDMFPQSAHLETWCLLRSES